MIPTDGGVGLFEAFWRYRKFTLLATMIAGLIGYTAVLFAPVDATYEVGLFLTDPRGSSVFRTGGSGSADMARHASQQASFVESRQTLMKAAEALGDDGIEQLRLEVAAAPTSSSDILIVCTAPSAQRTVDACNAVATAYIELSRERIAALAADARVALETERARILADPDLDPAVNASDEIDLRLADLSVTAALYDSGVEFTEGVQVEPPSRVLTSTRYAVAGLLFGAVGAAAVAWLQAERRPVVDEALEAASLLDMRLLGEVTSLDLRQLDLLGPIDDRHQVLSTGIEGLGMSGVMAVVPAARSASTSMACAQLAIAAARQGRRVVLIDGDLRNRRLTQAFGVRADTDGFSDVVSGLVQLEQALIECPVGSNAGFEFIACGQELRDPISLYGNDRVVETLDMLRAEYEVVLIDLPALIEHSETGVMLNRCDGVLLFVRAGSDAQELATVRRRLEVLTRGERGVVFQYGSS